MKNLTIKILCFVCVVLCVFSTRVWSGDVATAFDLNDELGDPDDTCPGLGQGNPVHVGLGNKFQEIVVYQGIGSNPLTFAWFYNSELLGQQAWRHNVQFMMNTPFVHSAGTAFWHDLDYRAADGSGAYIDVDKPIITSFYSGNNQCPGPVPPPRNLSHVENFSVDRSHKTRVTLADTGPYCRASRSILSIVYSKPDGVTETFTRQTPNNNPLQGFHAWNKSIAFPNGDKHQYNYRYDGAHYYVDARHSNGQSYEVKYALYFPSSSSPLHRILPESLTVGELVWTFEYRLIQGSGSFAYVLEKITGPGNNTMAFSYQSKPVDLGGYFRHQVMLTDWFVNGQHYAGWVYDDKQRAYRSYHGPNLSSHYASEDTFPDETMTGAIELSDLDHHDIRTSTNEYGQSTHYNFQILEGYEGKKKTKLIGLTGEASTNCLPTHSTIDYDTFWRKEQITDAKGNKTKYEYTAGEGARGHLERVIRAHETAIAQTTVIEYQDEDRKLVDRIIRNGLTINYDYYPNGRLSDITYTDTTQHEVPYPTHGQQRAYHIDYEYDNDNPDKVRKITVDGPRTDVHDVSVYEFDELGRLNKYVDAKGHETTFSNFNKWLVPETVTDPNGQITTLEYDDGFNQPLLSSIQPQGQAALTITYNDFELPEVATYPGGARFTYSYKTGDAASIYQVENQLGQRLLIDQSIDREEQVKHFITQTFDSEASVASFQYRHVLDALGRLYQTFSVDGMTEYHYDRNDNLEVMTRSGKNSRGADIDLESVGSFDGLNRIRTLIVPDAGTTHFQHNAFNRIDTVTDDVARSSLYVYNGFGDLIQVTSPDSGKTIHYYDSAGNLTGSTDARGVSVDYGYDELNRLRSVSYPASSHENVSLTYDEYDDMQKGRGYLTGMSGPSGSTRFVYNINGEITETEWVFKGHTYRTGYVYHNGLLKHITYPSGRKVQRLHDDMGRLEHLTTGDEAHRQTLVSDIQYLPFGPVSRFTYGNGLVQSNQYDRNYRPSERQTGNLIKLGYDYDDFKNLTLITDYINPAKNQSFFYEDADRLDEALGAYGSLLYDYNTIGNRESETLNGQFSDFIYSNNAQLQSVVGTRSRVYAADARGNTTKINEATLTYNHAARLSRIDMNSTVTQYLYNVFNQRVYKSSSDTVFHYDIFGNLVAESTAATGSFTKEYFYANGHLVALGTGYNTAQWIPLVLDDISVLIPNPAFVDAQALQLYAVHTNHLGAPVLVTDDQQSTVWQADYKPFGEAYISHARITLNIRLPGQYADIESGLYYNWHRYYEPSTGRYLTSDPLGMVDGPNTYVYVQNNPVNLVDPAGLRSSILNGRRTTHRGSWTNSALRDQANSIIQQIRRIDPAFNYNTVRPQRGPRSQYGRSDVQALQQFLQNAQSAGFCGPGAAFAPTFPTQASQVQHIFRNAPGHVNPSFSSSQSRYSNLFRQVGANPNNIDNNGLPIGAVRAGVNQHNQSFNNGEVWVQVRNGRVTNAGVNRNNTCSSCD